MEFFIYLFSPRLGKYTSRDDFRFGRFYTGEKIMLIGAIIAFDRVGYIRAAHFWR